MKFNTKVSGAFLIGIVHTFYSLNALTELEVDGRLGNVKADDWYPIKQVIDIFEALKKSDNYYPKLWYQAGATFIQAWYDHGGKELELGSIGHMKLQDNSQGIKLVFKDYDPNLLYSKVLVIDREKGYAEIELSDILPLEFVKGVFYNGVFLWGDFLWMDMQMKVINKTEGFTKVKFIFNFKEEDKNITIKDIESFVDKLELNKNIEISDEMAEQIAWKLKGMLPILEREHEVNHITNKMLGEALRSQVKISKDLENAKDKLELANRNIKMQSTLDFLTGLHNKRYFYELLDKMWFSSMRRSESITIFMIDIDQFKNYNDSYGHLTGDIVLKTVGKCILESINRSDDISARFGGEEFIIAVSNLDKKQILALTSKLQKRLYDENIEHESSKVSDRITVSIGTSTCFPNDKCDMDNIIECADNALYKAKESGRNIAIHSDSCEYNRKI